MNIVEFLHIGVAPSDMMVVYAKETIGSQGNIIRLSD
jgi:hypothetical protein